MELSVVMPSYNHGRFLRESMGAILGQSRKPSEVILVDDASTDGSREIAEAFAREHPNVRVLCNERNLGMLAAVQKGLQASSGQYIHLPAADDRIYPGLYAKSLEMLERHPAAGLCSSLIHFIDENGADKGPYPTFRIAEEACYLSPAEVARLLGKHGTWFGTQTAIYRRDAFREMGGYYQELGNYEDPFVCQVIALKFGACFIPEVLGAWRRSDAGFAGRMHRDLEAQIRIALSAVNLMGLSPYREVLPRSYARQWAREWLFGVLARVLASRRTEALEILDALRAPDAWDRAFRWSLRAVFWMERLAGRAYHFLRVRREPLGMALARKMRRLVNVRTRQGGA